MKKKSKKESLKEMLQEIQKPKESIVVEAPLPKTVPCSELWKKIKFKDKENRMYDAYIYHVEGNTYYVSQNKGFDTFCHAQTWVINKNQIV